MTTAHRAFGGASIDAVALRTLIRRLFSAADHRGVLDALLDNGPDGRRPSAGMLAVVRGEEFELVAHHDVPIDLPPFSPITAPVPVAFAIRESMPVWIESAADRDRWFPDLLELEQNPLAGAVLPLELDDRVVGALCLCFHYEHHFSEQERQHFGLLADLAAVSVERLELIAARG